MTMEEVEIGEMATAIVRFVQERGGTYPTRQAALQVAQQILGHAEQIAQANNKPESQKPPNNNGKFL